MTNEIVLAPGTEWVATADIPKLIAEALNPPVPEQPVTVAYFTKTARPGATGETAKWDGWPIDDDDNRVLAEIWGALPPLPEHATAEQVSPYLDAFATNGAALDWELGAVWHNAELHAALLRHDATRAHLKALNDAILSGELRPVAPHTRTPVPFPVGTQQYTEVHIDELTRYASKFHITVRAGEITPPESNQLKEPSLAFPLALREELAGAEHWSEKTLEALCCGVPPAEYCDRDDIAPELDRLEARNKILSAIRSGELYATAIPGAGIGERLYGSAWNINPARAIRWARSRFPKLPDWLARSMEAENYAQQEAEKNAAGRYTLNEAADAIATSGERAESILKKLLAAAESGTLPMHGPGESAKYQYAAGNRARPSYEEAYWDDLNEWLTKYEPRVQFRFPDPKPSEEGEATEPLIPVEDAIRDIARERWPDSSRIKHAEEMLESLDAYPSLYPSILAARYLTTRELRAQVSALAANEQLRIYGTANGNPTKALDGAFVAKAEMLQRLEAIHTHLSHEELKEVADAISKVATEWSTLARLQLLLIDTVGGLGEPTGLEHWFKHDNWSADDALWILSGVLPESVFMTETDITPEHLVSARYLDHSLIHFEGWQSENAAKDLGRLLGEEFRLAEEDLTNGRLRFYYQSYKGRQSVWRSGAHADRNPPRYYIDWAASKGFEVSWLEWARGNGYLAAADECVPEPLEPINAEVHRGKQQKQAQLILDWLLSNGHAPKKLKKPPTGKPGPKAAAKGAMLSNPQMFTPKSFEKAWEGLSAAGDIGYDA